ncbi:MAG: glycosyl hydrolase [Dehalococcoidia bacterium]|nr:glycosyl hydrolase [Dehalococcoidia bacterium]
MSKRIDDLLAELTLEEKADLMSGKGVWDVFPVERLGIPSLKVTDGPAGARGAGLLGSGTPALCIPCGSALGATWNPDLINQLGKALALETRARGSHVLLAPTVNIHRTPLGGRNFECYSEDPFLTSSIAVEFVKGVQSGGVGTTTKHFVANDSEFERNTIESVVPERALREIYLVPFEAVVKEAQAWGIMASYNRLDGVYACENERILTKILRQEWGFDGIVVSDWFATRSTANSVNAGLDLEMPGPVEHYGEKIVELVNNGEIDEKTVDTSVRRLLLLLERTGAFEDPLQIPERELENPDDHILVRQAAAESMVLLKNDDLLPFKEEEIKNIALIGPNAATAMIMGGGSAQLVPQYVVSPLEAFKNRFENCEIVYEPGTVSDRTSRPIARRILRTEKGQQGFSIEYFNGFECEGTSVATSSKPDGRLLHFEKIEGVDDISDFSFRAKSQLTSDQDGSHTLTLIQAGKARVMVNGETLIDGISDPIPSGEAFFGLGSEEVSVPLELNRGETVELVVEYSSEGSVALCGVQVGLRPPENEDILERALEVAKEADVVVMVVGTDEEWETEGRDREGMDLPGNQAELVRQVSACNPKTLVVVNSGSPITMDWVDKAAAVLVSWFGGQGMSDALVDVVLGDSEPSGRLPTTFPKRLEDTPAFTSYPGENSQVLYAEGVFVGYRWYDTRGIEVAFPFGYGLSYTTFDWSEPDLKKMPSIQELLKGETVELTISVTNTGDRAGTEVVQCYIEHVSPVLARPKKELKAFKKICLEPGETKEVEFNLGNRAFAYWDPADPGWAERSIRVPVAAGGMKFGLGHRDISGWYTDPGAYKAHLGSSSRDLKAEIDLEINEK